MSLINDALKRAKQAQQKQASPPGSGPLRPAETARVVAAPRTFLVPIVAAALLVFVGGILIVVALSRGFRLNRVDSATNSPTVAAAPLASNASPAANQPQSSPATLPLAGASNFPQAPVPALSVTQTQAASENSNAVTVVPVPAEPQLPKLQGILFNPTRPTAFLNGRSVTVGGRAGEFTVREITKEAVTIERAGRTNVLTMEEP